MATEEATAEIALAPAGGQNAGEAAKKDEGSLFDFLEDRTLWTRIWQGVAAASIALNLAAMAVEASAVAIVAGIVACCIAPVVIYLQFKLEDEDCT